MEEECEIDGWMLEHIAQKGPNSALLYSVLDYLLDVEILAVVSRSSAPISTLSNILRAVVIRIDECSSCLKQLYLDAVTFILKCIRGKLSSAEQKAAFRECAVATVLHILACLYKDYVAEEFQSDGKSFSEEESRLDQLLPLEEEESFLTIDDSISGRESFRRYKETFVDREKRTVKKSRLEFGMEYFTRNKLGEVWEDFIRISGELVVVSRLQELYRKGEDLETVVRRRMGKQDKEDGLSLEELRELEENAPKKLTPPAQVTSGRRQKWTEEEVQWLIEGMELFPHRWSEILKKYPFKSRTGVNLKDKWRNLIKFGHVKPHHSDPYSEEQEEVDSHEAEEVEFEEEDELKFEEQQLEEEEETEEEE